MASDEQQAITFIVPGQPLPEGVSSGTTRGGDAAPRSGPGRVKAAVRLGALRGEQPLQRLVAVPGEDVVVLHVAGGPALMLHPATARDLMLAQSVTPVTRGAETGEVWVNAQLRWRGLEQAVPAGVSGATRGLLGDVVLAAFEVLTGIDKDEAVDFVASGVVQRVDAQVDAGVYALNPAALAKLKGSGQKLAQVPGAVEPMLVLVHGTFVDTFSTFGKLWTLHPGRVRQLFDHYGGRVYALEHPTLGASPIANALTLVRALPSGARLHLLTHSRGGLVAEVLARAADSRGVGAADLAHFPGPAYATQRAELQELAALMRARGIRVERVLRVACPARGTLLASKRLDAYLSVLKWAIEASGVPLVPAFLELLTEVARRRADPQQIPGLAAMIAEAPLLNWLNATPEPIAGELRVVAGDIEGDSVTSWLKTLLADAYYWTDNDIVVQTRSMYAGAPRADGASFLLDQSGKTSHFAYFVNPRTVEAVVDGLVQLRPPQGFAPIGPLSWAGKDAGGLRGAEAAGPDPTRAAVFVLPGILGSNLAAEGQRIWLSLRLVGGLDRLAYEPGGSSVQPDGPIGMVYDKLIEHLAGTHEVIPFAFDWRRPIEEEARRLATAVTAALDARAATGQPVQLLAHSMGGLVARTMQLEQPAVWERLMAHEKARLLMLGTPNGGSYAPMAVLSGDDTFGNALAAFGSPLSDRKARRIMASMPGFLQLQAGLLDPALRLDRESEWRRLADADYNRMQQANWWHRHAGEAMEAAYHWGVPPQAVLDQAKALRLRLDEQVQQTLPRHAAKMMLVVGRAKTTPVAFEEGSDGFVYLDATDGDGRVPLQSALLPGVRTWQMDCEHGSLPSEKAAFGAFVELLQDGTTTQLAPFSPSRGTPLRAALTASRPSRTRKAARPASSQAEVFSAGDAATPLAPAAAPGATALQVTVLNGNLSFVGQPLLVGHYRSSELTGTEAVVNRLLGGRMKEALDAGLYPEALGTHLVFTNNRRDPENPWRVPRPAGVVVVGLGDEGGLGEGKLSSSVRQAVVAWSQRLAEAQPGAQAVTELAATLLGSGGFGISASAAARAITRGVREANRLLAGAGWPLVSRLTLVEIYLDRAAEAWQGLQVLASSSPGEVVLDTQIVSGTGPLRRQLESGYRGADYDLITATSQGDSSIEFALDSRRARTEVRSQQTQVRLVRELVKKAATARVDDPQIGRILFQLLVPVEIEPFLGGTDRMVLDLDAGTAAVPWELLDTGSSGSDGRPWALRTMLLRRLRTTSFRQRPLDANANDDVLVIAEPLLDADSPYPPLPAARDEGLAVTETLTQAGSLSAERVVALVDAPDATTVVSQLLSRNWRIVHIAGHGEALADGGRGVVLSGGNFLGAAEICAMRTVPELVFINCCHLGAFDAATALADPRSARAANAFEPALFAASVAEALIATGVRCVVACGWAVEDTPAEVFARTFYAELLAGARFIDAVGRAREACWQASPSGKTWAAYQCYGDADWRFTSAVGDAQAPTAYRDGFAAIGSAVELALVLDTLATESRFMGKPGPAQRERLRQLEARFAGPWGDIGAVAEAYAVAWSAAGDTDRAVLWYERALLCNDASASMKAAEQLANLRVRQAWAGWSETAAQAAPATSAGDSEKERREHELWQQQRERTLARHREQLAGALADLKALSERTPSMERLSLLGSACKRQALIARAAGEPAAERQALMQAAQAYAAAEALARQQSRTDLFYPALNRMAIELVLSPRQRPAWAEQAVDEVRTALADSVQREPDFWGHVGLVELSLYEALAGGRLGAEQAGISAGYADVHQRVPAPWMWASALDQLQFVLGPLLARDSGGEATAARALLLQVAAFAHPEQARLQRWKATLPAPPRTRAAVASRAGEASPGPRVVLWAAAGESGATASKLASALLARGCTLWQRGPAQGTAELGRALAEAALVLVLFGALKRVDDLGTLDERKLLRQLALRPGAGPALAVLTRPRAVVPGFLASAPQLDAGPVLRGDPKALDALLAQLPAAGTETAAGLP